jgi:hypothetical protein
MSRSNLNTSVGGNHNRYSFMETPLEMHPSTKLPNLSLHPPDSRARPAQEPEEPRMHRREWSYAPSEKQLQDQGVMPDQAKRPAPEQHPANYAPMANVPEQPESFSPPMSPQYATAHRNQYSSAMSPQYATVQANQRQNPPLSPQYATVHGNQQYSPPISPHYPTTHGNQYGTYGASQSYTTLPHQTISHQYINQYKATSPQEDSTQLSPQSYATYSHAQSYPTIPDQQRSLSISPQPYTSYTETPVSPEQPKSPGPLPVKVSPESPGGETVTIAPDSNPLQSPQESYFPPPTRTATQPASYQQEDLSAYHQPGQTTHPNQEVTGGGWSNGLCEFSNLGICCLGAFCPCILYGRTQHRLSMKSKKEDPTNMLSYETCNASCTAMGLLCGCQCKHTIPHSLVSKSGSEHKY